MPTAPSSAIAPNPEIFRKPAQYIRDRVLPALRDLNDELGKMDALDKEIATRRAQLDVVTRDVAAMKNEFDELKREYDKILAAAHAKQAESERLDKEIKALRKELAQLNEWRDKMLQQLQR